MKNRCEGCPHLKTMGEIAKILQEKRISPLIFLLSVKDSVPALTLLGLSPKDRIFCGIDEKGAPCPARLKQAAKSKKILFKVEGNGEITSFEDCEIRNNYGTTNN
ncbi:MAG: hypothetical protein NZM02_00350 [Patescibacteria group bacterium]|nr:hypothetical protein [Patescibacteria group bacterium]